MNPYPLLLSLFCVPHSLILLQKHVCQLLADHWKPLQFAASWLSLVPFPFSFLLYFFPFTAIFHPVLDLTPSLAPFLQTDQGMANVTFHGEACTKDMDKKSPLLGLWTLLQTVHIHPCFGYIWLTRVSSFPQLLRIFLCLFLERALLLQPLSEMGSMF